GCGLLVSGWYQDLGRRRRLPDRPATLLGGSAEASASLDAPLSPPEATHAAITSPQARRHCFTNGRRGASGPVPDDVIDHLEHLGKLPHDRRSRAGYIEPVALSEANRRQIEPRRPALRHLLILCLPKPT